MTARTSLISKPRAATSVAMSTGQMPTLKASMVRVRSYWSLSPCIAAHRNCKRRGMDRSNWSHKRFEFAKTIIRHVPCEACTSFLTHSASNLSFSPACVTKTCWVTSALAFKDPDVSPTYITTCVKIKILRRVRAESSRRPPRHRRDACSMAWRCRFLTARRSQHGSVIAET